MTPGLKIAAINAKAPQETWAPPPQRLFLQEGVVHVWRADLNQGPAVAHAFRNFLSPDEWRRANKFCFEKDRLHFVVARAALREILGHYLEVSPEAIRFSSCDWGKPALKGDAQEARIRFNVSHSDRLALYAVTDGREVGIDLELIRRDVDCLAIAESYFSPKEISALRVLPPEEQITGFFNCSTRKEAFIKARAKVSRIPSEPVHGIACSGRAGGHFEDGR